MSKRHNQPLPPELAPHVLWVRMWREMAIMRRYFELMRLYGGVG